jgi:hypothetical protein
MLSALFSPKMRCVCHFILNEADQNSALALHWSFNEAARAPLERALDPGGRPRPRRGPRESRGRGRGVVASGTLQEL